MPEIMRMLSTPANVFDRWAPFEVDDLRQQAVNLQRTIADMSEKFSKELDAREVELSARDASLQKADEFVLSLVGRAERAEEYALSLEKELAKERNQDPLS
jgi:hypothetical protein